MDAVLTRWPDSLLASQLSEGQEASLRAFMSPLSLLLSNIWFHVSHHHLMKWTKLAPPPSELQNWLADSRFLKAEEISRVIFKSHYLGLRAPEPRAAAHTPWTSIAAGKSTRDHILLSSGHSFHTLFSSLGMPRRESSNTDLTDPAWIITLTTILGNPHWE